MKRDECIKLRLRAHSILMKRYANEHPIDQSEASKQAFRDVKGKSVKKLKDILNDSVRDNFLGVEY